MTSPSFYVMESAQDRFGRKWAYAEASRGYQYGDHRDCSVCGRCVASREWLPPWRVNFSQQKCTTAVFGTVVPPLFDEKFVHRYSESELKGIEDFRRVEVVKMGRKKPPEIRPPAYSQPKVAVSAAYLDEKASQFVWGIPDPPPTCSVCHCPDKSLVAYLGYHFVRGSWSGEDVFYPSGQNLMSLLVSERFVKWWEGCQFTGAKFIPAEEYVPSYVSRNQVQHVWGKEACDRVFAEREAWQRREAEKLREWKREQGITPEVEEQLREQLREEREKREMEEWARKKGIPPEK